MEQGNCLDNTPVSARQGSRRSRNESGLDAAVKALLTRPDKARIDDDARLIALGSALNAAQAMWLPAVAANNEPSKLCAAYIDAAMARGVPAIAAHEAAWALPGVKSANDLEESAYATAAGLAQEALRMRPRTLAGLAVQARAVTVLVWTGGDYTADAALGEGEDVDKEAVRNLIESALALEIAGPAASGRLNDLFADPDEHPGFILMPAHKPTALVAIESAIPMEAQRLLDVARAEFDRRRACYARFPLGERAEHIERMRAEYRIDALEALAAPIQADTTAPCPGMNDEALWRAVAKHRDAKADATRASIAADCVLIRKEGGHTSAAAMAPLVAASAAADAEDFRTWREVFQARPSTLSGLVHLLRHTAKNYDAYDGIDDAPDVFGALIGAVEGLRFASHPRPAEYDLSLLSVSELERLAGIARREREGLMAVLNSGLYWSSNQQIYSALGRILNSECDRMGFLADEAVHEVERRRPTEENEINLRLETLVRRHLNCNGYIEPELLTEVIEAWGAR